MSRTGGGAALHVVAVGGLVRLLCDARLAVLVLAALLGVLEGAGQGIAMTLLALPFSFVPLRTWDRRGEMWLRSRILLTCDVIMTVCVLLLLVTYVRVPVLATFYAGTTAVLLGAVLRRRWAMTSTMVLVATVVTLGIVTDGPALGTALLSAAVVLGLAWTGDRVGRLLRDQAETARELARARAEEATTQERAALAREMHDSVAKTVHGVGLLASSLSRDLMAAGSPLAERAGVIETACRTANRDTRALLAGLRVLTCPSLEGAVDSAVDRWSVAAAIPVELEITRSGPTTVGAETAWTVVRVLSEALENVHRHAEATLVNVGLTVGDWVELTVRDNGTGLPDDVEGAAGWHSLERDGHYGLVGMIERAAEIGGTGTVCSPDGIGTVVHVRVPAIGIDVDRVVEREGAPA